MSNNGRITLCPYYRDEKNKSISCEDTFHTFRWKKQKYEWMDTYCDKDWESCPYADALTHMYDEIERGDLMAEEKHTVEALQKEIKNLASKLGRAEKRLEPKEEEIKQLRKKNHKIEQMYFEEHRKYMQLNKSYEELKDKIFKKIENDLESTVQMFRTRMCYLLDKTGELIDEDVEAWAKDKDYKLSHEEGVWKVIFDEKQVRK